jgi:uncharacterized membrane protein YqgA involved in biofilm formation
VTGTWIHVATVVVGTVLGATVGARLTTAIQERVRFGLGMVTLVIGIDLALARGRRRLEWG